MKTIFSKQTKQLDVTAWGRSSVMRHHELACEALYCLSPSPEEERDVSELYN